jgi:hypothetical protein
MSPREELVADEEPEAPATRSQLGELRDEIKRLETISSELTGRVRDLVEGGPTAESSTKEEVEPVKRQTPLLFEAERIRRVNTRLQGAIQRLKRFGT